MATLLALAPALSMAAFAAALSEGSASRPRATAARALYVGLAFGGAQAIMPLVGFGLGMAFLSVVRDVDHWIAFVLLSVDRSSIPRAQSDAKCHAIERALERRSGRRSPQIRANG